MKVSYLFYSIFLYQFLFATLFSKNILYFIFSPYSLSLIVILFFFFREKTDPIFKNYYPIFYLIFVILIIIICKTTFSESINIFNVIKKFQFTFGILLLIPGLLILRDLFNIKDIKIKLNYNIYIKYLIIFISSITILEFISVNILNFSPVNMFYINESFIDVSNKNTQGPFGHRPYGMLFYPQPNGILIAFLTSLYLLSTKQFNSIVMFGVISLILSQSYSGMILFILVLVTISKFKTRKILFLLGAIFLALILYLYSNSDFFYKFSPRYFEILLFKEGQLITQLLSVYNLNIYELIFGVVDSQKEMSHEWFYTAVVREYGLIGLAIFFTIFSKIIFYSLPISMSKLNKINFLLFFLLVNAHYPAMCFISFQILLVLIYSINNLEKKY